MSWRIPSAKPYFPGEDVDTILAEVREVIQSGRLVADRHVLALEEEFAQYIGTAFAIAVSSGTSALEIIYRYFRVAGGEIIVPTNTFVATANAALLAGADVVFADVEPDSFCMDPADVARRINARTRAVVVVHISGLVTPGMNRLRELCAERGVRLIEDAAHAHGAAIGGRRAGALADAAAFSFFATKVMTTGEGGVITTDDPHLAEFARCIRAHGVTGPNRESVMLGHNWRMHELAAILGRAQLRRLDEFLRRRNALAERYRAQLGGVPHVQLPALPEGFTHSYYKFLVRLSQSVDRDRLRERMIARGIECALLYHPPVHAQPFYATSQAPLDLRGSAVLKQVLALPMFVEMTEAHVDEVAAVLRREITASLRGTAA
jgi:dTDP-4-amino-4,6-dideoxygalactose transaminase